MKKHTLGFMLYKETHGYVNGSLPVHIDNGLKRNLAEQMTRKLVVSVNTKDDLVGASDRLVGFNDNTVWR
jgi:hypothetical protein